MLIVIHFAIQSNNEFHIFGNLWELCRSPASLLHHLVEISKRLPAALDSHFLPTCNAKPSFFDSIASDSAIVISPIPSPNHAKDHLPLHHLSLRRRRFSLQQVAPPSLLLPLRRLCPRRRRTPRCSPQAASGWQSCVEVAGCCGSGSEHPTW